MTRRLDIYKTSERPSLELWLLDRSRALIDFSSGYTFVFKIGNPGSAAMFTKTTGITGAAGSGVEPTGTPNVTIAFTADELDDLTVGTFVWQLAATTSSLDRFFQGVISIRDVIT